jgi:ABC-type antimicrobial peptide transport system permease subunit
VLVFVPGIGYVEEQWIQKGVNLLYRQGIQTGSWILIGAVLLAGAFFTLDLIWADVAAEGRWIALRKALGWRSDAVFRRVIGRALLIAALAAGLGTAIAWIVIRSTGWMLPDPRLWAALPVALIALAGLASVPPAWSASRVPPAVGIHRQAHQGRRARPMISGGLVGLAWNALARQPSRTVLAAIGSAISAALLALLLAVTLDQRGLLSGTLLGQFILQRIESYHYGIVGIGFALAALSIFNGELMSISQRRREIGLAKAVGWRTGSVAALFITEGALVGLLGGSVGSLIGLAVFVDLFGAASSSVLPIFLGTAAMAGLVGAMAAVYPAGIAARVPPAEAVRYE